MIRRGVRICGRERRFDRRGVTELVGMCVREARVLASWTQFPAGAAMGSGLIIVARVMQGKAPGVLARVCR